MSVILKKNGFYAREWIDKKWVTKKISLMNLSLLGHWSEPLEIEDGFKLKHLVKLLKDMSSLTLYVTEMLTQSTIADYLEKANGPLPDEDKSSSLKRIEIYKSLDISNYTKLDQYKIDIDVGCHGVGKRWKEGNGNTYAIEFTEWGVMWDLPIVIRPTIRSHRTEWKKGKNSFANKELRKIMGRRTGPGRKIKKVTEEEFTTYSLTLGEFFEGFTNELCFFGSPTIRDAERNKLGEIVKDLESQLKRKKKE